MKNIAKSLLPGCIFFIIIFGLVPLEKPFELDPDEGINLIKSVLYNQGFSLYTEIWNDQPPLFTVFLGIWIKIWGQSIVTARSLTLVFSSIIIVSFWGIISNYLGALVATLSMILLVTSYYFLQVSISAMIGIPCIAMTMLSIYLLVLYQPKENKIYLIISGLLIAVSLQIKLFSAFLIPIMILYFIILPKNHNQNQLDKYKNASIFCLVLLISYLIIGFWFNVFDYDQILQAHLAKETKTAFQRFNSFAIFETLIFKDWDVLILGLLGAVLMLKNKKYSDREYFPLIWLFTIIIIFVIHQPIWYHYYILVSLPLCWLSAYGIDYLFKIISKLTSQKSVFLKITVISLVATMLCGLLTFQYLKVHYFIARLHKEKDGYQHRYEILSLIKQNHRNNDYMFTDRPIYAFYSKLMIPPELAVFSRKRLVSGNLTDQEIVDYLEKYQTEQILISRFRNDFHNNVMFQNYLKDKYVLIYESKEVPFNEDDVDKPELLDSLYLRKK